jgi:high-affinity iron transporter
VTAGKVRGERISVTTTTCAPGWRAPNPGRDHFAVANQSGRRAVIYLFHPLTGKVVAKLSHDPPHSVRELTVRLTPGVYMWGCDLHGMPPRTSESQTVPRDPDHGGGPPVVPVTAAELAGPRRAYLAYLAATLRRVAAQVGTLRADIAAGRLAAARTAWLTAHRAG